jgi:hypothetical protein
MDYKVARQLNVVTVDAENFQGLPAAELGKADRVNIIMAWSAPASENGLTSYRTPWAAVYY